MPEPQIASPALGRFQPRAECVRSSHSLLPIGATWTGLDRSRPATLLSVIGFNLVFPIIRGGQVETRNAFRSFLRHKAHHLYPLFPPKIPPIPDIQASPCHFINPRNRKANQYRGGEYGDEAGC